MTMTPEPYDNPQPIREISFVKRLCPLLWFSFGPIPGDSWSLLWSVYTYFWGHSLWGQFLNVTPLMLVWPRLLPSWNHFESPVIFWIRIDIYTVIDYFVNHCQSKRVVRLPQSAFILLSHAATVNSLMNMASMFECIMEGYKLTAVTSACS